MRSLFATTLVLASLLLARPVDAAGRPDDPGARGRERALRNSRVQKALENRPVVPVDRALDARSRRVVPELGTGRLGDKTIPSRRAGRRIARDVQGRLEKRLDRRSRRDRAVRIRERIDRRRDGEDDAHDVDRPRPDRPQLRPRGSARHAERLLSKRLAAIDHLRDVALENGNVELLARADTLEELARRQFQMRTEGTKLDWGHYQRMPSDPSTDPVDGPGEPDLPPTDDPDMPVADPDMPPADAPVSE